jgi:hypothetical protein
MTKDTEDVEKGPDETEISKDGETKESHPEKRTIPSQRPRMIRGKREGTTRTLGTIPSTHSLRLFAFRHKLTETGVGAPGKKHPFPLDNSVSGTNSRKPESHLGRSKHPLPTIRFPAQTNGSRTRTRDERTHSLSTIWFPAYGNRSRKNNTVSGTKRTIPSENERNHAPTGKD